MDKTEHKLDVCKRTRMFAAASLHSVLSKMLSSEEPITELSLNEEWLAEMRKSDSIEKDGWYIPPKNGIGVIFATDESCARLHHKSLRKMESQAGIELDIEKGMAYVYASPVDRETHIIGDFGMTFYLGKNPAIINHLKKCLDINREIFASIKAGMNLSEVQRLGMEIIGKNHVSNDVVSVTETDSTSIIGHTIPASYEEWTAEEIKIMQESWTTAKDLISNKRKFLSGAERLRLKNGMAITIEPRLIGMKDKKIPMASYHSIAVLHADGTKDLLENFSDIFDLTNMNYML